MSESARRDAQSALALWFVAPGRVELRDERLADPTDRQVLARGLASCVSEGTEMLLYRGEGPEPFDPSLEGPIETYPRRYGYAWVGEVTRRGPGASLAEGTRVFALAPHGEAHVFREEDARALPPDVPATRATLAASLETAVTVTWDAEASLGDRAVVLGGGAVGILVAWLLSRTSARVTLVEPRATRRAAARALAPSIALADHAEPDGRADVVVEATGDPRSLDAAIAWAAPEARVVVASFYGAKRAPIGLGDAFHRRRLDLRSSQVSSIPPRLRPRWDRARRFALVTDLLREPLLDGLFAPPFPFARAPELYAALDGAGETAPAHAFSYTR